MAIVSVSLNDEEERILKKYSEAMGLSVATYMKYVATNNMKMIKALHETVKAIEELPYKTQFRIKNVIPKIWSELDQGERRTLGIAMNNLIENKKIVNVTIVDSSNSNGAIYEVSYQAKTVKFEMCEERKAQMRDLLEQSEHYLKLCWYSKELSDFCDRIMQVMNAALDEQNQFIDNRQSEVYNHVENTDFLDWPLIAEYDNTFMRVELDPEAIRLIEGLIDLHSKCVANLFKRKV